MGWKRDTCRFGIWAGVAFLFASAALRGQVGVPAREGSGKVITVDFGRQTGEIRPLHGVNGGPVDSGEVFDVSAYWRELEVPLARLNPWAFPDPYVVDMPLIFPLFHLDPDKPVNYSFAKTDEFIAAILKTRAQIVYRLGTTIEHSKRKYYIHPPADYDKWARIAVNIIRHYNEGWADGFRHGIRYWEIWNEPNIPQMWTGSAEDYFRLYETAVRAIKKYDARLKVGGPALAGWNDAYAEKFLSFCRERSLPLDFFSWHIYAVHPVELQQQAVKVREALDRHGFTSTESHLNEWNHLPNRNFFKNRFSPTYMKRAFERINGIEGAAFAASSLILFQDSPIDAANFYTGDTLRWGLFANFGVPNKCYFAFKAFRALLDTPRRTACEGSDAASGLAAAAGVAADGGKATVLLSNFENSARRFTIRMRNVPWQGRTIIETFALDAEHDLTRMSRESGPAGELAIELECPSPSVRLLKLSPAEE